MEKIASTPSEFTLHGRNKERHVHVGGQSIINTMVSSAPNVSDLERGRILGNFEDYTNLIKLGEMLNTVHAFGGYPVEPCDVDVSVRHLQAVSAAVRLSTKPLFGYAIGSERMLDAIEIIRIGRGINEDTLLKEPSITTVVNANSPLVYDKALLEGAIEMAEHNQPVIYTPFTLAGAMAPITVAGALVQQNAEALAGLAFHQCVKPGAPAMYGSFTSNVDMKSGSPAFGTPEYTQATIASGQLARKYKIPLRASNANASNAPDEQSVYESQMSLWACLLGQVNFILHGHGWIEGGLCASYEKVILDAEMNQMMEAFSSACNCK
jgi:Trimethylamine:corrinoid methyltransferase